MGGAHVGISFAHRFGMARGGSKGSGRFRMKTGCRASSHSLRAMEWTVLALSYQRPSGEPRAEGYCGSPACDADGVAAMTPSRSAC